MRVGKLEMRFEWVHFQDLLASAPDFHVVEDVALGIVVSGVEGDADLDVLVVPGHVSVEVLPVLDGLATVVVVAGDGSTVDGGPAPAEDVVAHVDGLDPFAAGGGGAAELEFDGEVVLVLEVAVFGDLETNEGGLV